MVDSNPGVNIHLIELGKWWCVTMIVVTIIKFKMQTDVRDVDAHAGAVDYVRQTVRDAGLNVLVNNAGVGGRSVRLAATKELDVLDAFRVNACAPVMLTKVGGPAFRGLEAGDFLDIIWQLISFKSNRIDVVLPAAAEDRRGRPADRRAGHRAGRRRQHVVGARIDWRQHGRCHVRVPHVKGGPECRYQGDELRVRRLRGAVRQHAPGLGAHANGRHQGAAGGDRCDGADVADGTGTGRPTERQLH